MLHQILDVNMQVCSVSLLVPLFTMMTNVCAAAFFQATEFFFCPHIFEKELKSMLLKGTHINNIPQNVLWFAHSTSWLDWSGLHDLFEVLPPPTLFKQIDRLQSYLLLEVWHGFISNQIYDISMSMEISNYLYFEVNTHCDISAEIYSSHSKYLRR